MIEPGPRQIGCAGQSRFRGCRVGHEIIRDHVVLEIRAGSIGDRAINDEPAQFLISRTGLDELIDELKSIRAKVAEAELAEPWRNRRRQQHSKEFVHG
jgi:hypothetical protein